LLRALAPTPSSPEARANGADNATNCVGDVVVRAGCMSMLPRAPRALRRSRLAS
jgi:hypothetical protein